MGGDPQWVDSCTVDHDTTAMTATKSLLTLTATTLATTTSDINHNDDDRHHHTAMSTQLKHLVLLFYK